MSDLRQELHNQVDQTREEDLDRLIGFLDSFLHPLESPTSERIVFRSIRSGSAQAAGMERQRQQILDGLRASESDKIRSAIGHEVSRLGIDLNQIGQGASSWSGSRDQSEEFTRSWREGRVFNRLSMFHIKEQKIVMLERCYFTETQPDLIYKVRVLTPLAEAEKDLTVPALNLS